MKSHVPSMECSLHFATNTMRTITLKSSHWPITYRKKTLEPMKSLKWRYLRDLLHRCQYDQDMLERCINKVKELRGTSKEELCRGNWSRQWCLCSNNGTWYLFHHWEADSMEVWSQEELHNAWSEMEPAVFEEWSLTSWKQVLLFIVHSLFDMKEFDMNVHE